MRKIYFFIVAMLLLTAACKKTLDETGATTRTVSPTNPAELSCVELLQPQNGATNVILPIQFRWSCNCPKDSFRFLLLKKRPFGIEASFDTLLNTVTRDTALLYAPTYYEESISYQWKVKNLSQKDTNLWSRSYIFTPPDARDSIIGNRYNIKRSRFIYEYPNISVWPAGTGNFSISKNTTLNGGLVVQEIGNPQSITELINHTDWYQLYPNGAFSAVGPSCHFDLGVHRDSFSFYVVTKRDPSAFAVEGYFFNGRFR
jgi:hypothetical protein